MTNERNEINQKMIHFKNKFTVLIVLWVVEKTEDPSIHPSIQEFEHRNPGFPHPGHLFQLTESFPGQSRHVIPPASSGSWSSESQPTELLILSLRESRKLISTTCTYGLIFSHYPELMTIGEGGPPGESPPYWSGGVCVYCQRQFVLGRVFKGRLR